MVRQFSIHIRAVSKLAAMPLHPTRGSLPLCPESMGKTLCSALIPVKPPRGAVAQAELRTAYPTAVAWPWGLQNPTASRTQPLPAALPQGRCQNTSIRQQLRYGPPRHTGCADPRNSWPIPTSRSLHTLWQDASHSTTEEVPLCGDLL